MSLVNIVRETPINRTARVQQIEGIFEMKAAEHSKEEWTVDLPLEEQKWNVGLIVGPSGSGKSTIANEVFSKNVVKEFEWKSGYALVDSFDDSLSIKEIAFALSSVGFGSPPNWLRPYEVLSTGEKFRANLARCLTISDLVVIDEFTSVVDRTVAQIGSHAMAKAVRRQDRQFVGVACHADIIDWLQPDWVYEPATNEFTWRSLRQRPKINIEIKRCHRRLWKIFSKYHYLNHEINISSKCFVACVDGEPVAFEAVIAFPHPKSAGWRLHRTVCLPDYQGAGIGTILEDKVASIMRATGKPVYNRMSHPAIMAAKAKSPVWKMTQRPKRTGPLGKSSKIKRMGTSQNRITAGFKYVGPIDFESAKTLQIV